MNELIKRGFNFNGNNVTVIIDDNGEPWWVASEVCDVLGLSNPTEAIRGLDENEKSTLSSTEGGPPRNIINEPGLYTLIFKSPRRSSVCSNEGRGSGQGKSDSCKIGYR